MASEAVLPTSAVLTCASKHIQASCAEQTRAFTECKTAGKDPRECIAQGKALTGCALATYGRAARARARNTHPARARGAGKGGGGERGGGDHASVCMRGRPRARPEPPRAGGGPRGRSRRRSVRPPRGVLGGRTASDPRHARGRSAPASRLKQLNASEKCSSEFNAYAACMDYNRCVARARTEGSLRRPPAAQASARAPPRGTGRGVRAADPAPPLPDRDRARQQRVQDVPKTAEGLRGQVPEPVIIAARAGRGRGRVSSDSFIVNGVAVDDRTSVRANTLMYTGYSTRPRPRAPALITAAGRASSRASQTR